MPMLRVRVRRDYFTIITSYGAATFTLNGEYAEIEDLRGVYARQSTSYKDPEDADRILEVVAEHFDDRVVAVIGEAPIHCPDAFIISRGGRVSGLDAMFRNAELSDNATINIPSERVSPGAMSWPRTWFLIIAEDGAWLIPYSTILENYNPARIVDIDGSFSINLPKDLAVRVK